MFLTTCNKRTSQLAFSDLKHRHDCCCKRIKIGRRSSVFKVESDERKVRSNSEYSSNKNSQNRRRCKVCTDTDSPPKSCIPNKAKTTMKRKRRKSKLTMDFMEFNSETTRFLSGAQYLRKRKRKAREVQVTLVLRK